MAEAVTSFVVETIGNLLIEEGKFLLGVGDQVELLLDELKRMKSFLKDADTNKNDSDMIREWVSQTRDLAYEAENLIEHYAFKVQSRKGNGVVSIIKRCVCLLDECLTRRQVGTDIESLNLKISALRSSFEGYGLKASTTNEVGSSSRRQPLRRTYSNVDKEYLVGVEDQVEMLAEKLFSENYKLVSISGMGGLGKTTMARKVYHHEKVRHYFDAFSWICVSEQWETNDLLQRILTKFMTEKKKEILSLDELVRELSDFQQNRKCLVVVDDIWSVDAWEAIKAAFRIREMGSKVVVTTRNIEVAKHIDASGFLHQPQFLSQEQSWDLLKRKSSLLQRPTTDIERMEKLGKEMVEHCGGLPLAILALGGILATKNNLMDWENVRDNVKSYLSKENKIGQDEVRLQNILALSYNDLPYQLKPCFLYLSGYPEDMDIETEPLYQIWMAEGIISMEDRMGEEPMMAVADRYLGQLAERCMVFIEEKEVPSIIRFKSCRLHDLMRELCLSKAKEENFLEFIGNQRPNNNVDVVDVSTYSRRTPRLAVSLSGSFLQYVPLPKDLSQQLRSFTLIAKGLLLDKETTEGIRLQCDRFKMLRVLSIEGRYNEWTFHIPRAISSLIHLRYFSFRGRVLLDDFSFLSKFKHLQTLDLRWSTVRRSSKALVELKGLKHLYLPDVATFPLAGFVNLEILENFNPKYDDVKVLSTLKSLRSLDAKLWSGDILEEFVNQVNTLKYLRFLSLQIWDSDFDSEKGSTLLRKVFSWSHLYTLDIRSSILKRLPEYETDFLFNIHKLSFISTKMEEDPMRTLQMLPNLRTLTLDKSFMGEEMICNAIGFPQLKHLYLRLLINLSRWKIEEGAMPNLCHLQIALCKKLKMIPDGLRFVNALKELEIRGMPEEFKKRIKDKNGKEGEDFDKVRHVPSIIVSQW